MKKLFLLLGIVFMASSCSNDEKISPTEDTNSKKLHDCGFDHDIINDHEVFSTETFQTSAIVDLIDNLDTDNDGISDYAEDRIAELDKNNGNDAKALNAGDTITIFGDDTKEKLKIPFYQTSYYQNNFANLAAPTYRTDQLSEGEIALIADLYPKWLKILRTPEFQNYILTKPAGEILGKQFIEKARNHKKGIEFRSEPDYQWAVGVSNMWNYISISHWAMAPGYTNYIGCLPHEFIHHIGYGHEHDYAYGGGYKAHEMYNNKKYEYDIIDLEKKKLYGYRPVPSKWSDTNGYVVLHFAEFLDLNYIITKANWATSALNFNDTLDFSRNQSYTLKICTLNAQRVSIWIDFNDDAEYTNDERVLINGYCNGGWGNTLLNFTIPAEAKKGNHYMRINSSFYTSNPSAYGPNIYGSSFNFSTVNIR